MPTGYTYEILSGRITTFSQFAKLCMRAFGSTIHMRDKSLQAEYTPRVLSDFHMKKLGKAKKFLKKIETSSDEEIISSQRIVLEKSKANYLKVIAKAKANSEILNNILTDTRKWLPPTREHSELKSFMIEQILSTIDFDCGTEYEERKLAEIELELRNLDPVAIRKDSIKKAERDIEYHTREHEKDVERCEHANQWVASLLNSL